MHKTTFFPLGNADCCRIDLNDGRKMLFDYAHCRDPEDKEDLRIDLYAALHEDLEAAGRDYFDVTAFTHADDDHIKGATEFFYLEHANKYQGDGRVKINELWVPAAMIVEENLKEEAKVIRSEARYRLKLGKRIRVFSRPERLKEWLEKEGIKLEDRKHLITDAGQLVPGFNKMPNGVEFFVHSPFAKRVENGLVDRNESSLIFHVTFNFNGQETKFMLIGDTTHEVLTEIVDVTKYHKREARLQWDIFDVPHHCSYLALGDERGKDKTEPVPNVKWLFEQGNRGGILVSTSRPIPDNDEDPQPPHRQAANYYKERASKIGGDFAVTMEHPTEANPKPLVITIDGSGATLKKLIITGGAAAGISRPAPRAGRDKYVF